MQKGPGHACKVCMKDSPRSPQPMILMLTSSSMEPSRVNPSRTLILQARAHLRPRDPIAGPRPPRENPPKDGLADSFTSQKRFCRLVGARLVRCLRTFFCCRLAPLPLPLPLLLLPLLLLLLRRRRRRLAAAPAATTTAAAVAAPAAATRRLMPLKLIPMLILPWALLCHVLPAPLSF